MLLPTMTALNLPPFEYRVKEEDGKPHIFDVVRRKYVKLDPEEWVRQHIVHWLLRAGYPRSLMQVESGQRINQMQKRSDLVVRSREGSPFLLIECKAPSVTLSNSTFRQAALYNQTYQAPYLGISNGLKHYFCHIDWQTQKISYLDRLPTFT